MKKVFFTFIILFVSFVLSFAQDGPSGFYQTNPTLGKKVSSPITIDGNPSEWSEDMLIVQGVANDDARAFRGAHEGPVQDLYQLYAAWDDDNLYLMWQYTNVSDVASPGQDFPSSSTNGKPYNVDMPIQIAFDIDPATGTNGLLSGKTTEGVAGSHVWDVYNMFPNNNVDKLLMFSSKPGVGTPAIFHINENTNAFDYGYLSSFSAAGITYQCGDYCVPTEIWGINRDEHVDFSGDVKYRVTDLEEESLYVDFLTLGHQKKHETVYEMKIPLTALGIDADYLESDGVGVMIITTYGISGINSLPYDPATFDNAEEPYSQEASTSKEKEDVDHFTAAFARIAKGSGEAVTRPQLTVTPASGTYIGGTQATLTATGENTPIKIYYTLDGSTPTTASASLNSGGQIDINSSCTLKAIAVDAENVSSFVKTCNYITEVIIPTGIKVSFKLPADWGEGNGVNIWAWNAGGNNFAGWPGATMTNDGDGWYSYTFDESVQNVNVVLSKNHSGAEFKSADISSITESTCFESTSSASPFATKKVDCPTIINGIIPPSVGRVQVFPNPASVSIVLNTTDEMSEVKIISVDGALCKVVNNYLPQSEINIASLPEGMYILHMTDKNGNKKTAKFIKK